jgi:hypothetical protein
MRRLQRADSFERDAVKWFDEDFEFWNEAAQDCPDFTWARPLAIDRVVYQIN